MPQATDSLLKAKLCIRFNVSDPEAGLVINAKERPLHIEYGRSNNHKPDLDVDITGEALHQILLGQLSLTKAVGSKKVKPKVKDSPGLAQHQVEVLYQVSRDIQPQEHGKQLVERQLRLAGQHNEDASLAPNHQGQHQRTGQQEQQIGIE